MTLTPKQKKFVSEYLIDLNGKQAAIRSGYSPKTAEVQASRLLSVAKVNEEIAKAMIRRSIRTEVTQDEVIEALRETRDICMGRRPTKITKFVKSDKGDEPAELEAYVFEPSAANKAGELLGKHIGMFSDKVDMTVTTVKTLSDFYGEETDT